MPHAYESIARQLHAEIASETYPTGTLLPTIPDLMDRFGVSRITVRQALEQLANAGLIYTGYLDGKRGTIVRSRGRLDHYPTDSIHQDRRPSDHDTFEESVLKAGREPQKRFVMRIETAPAQITKRLGVAANDLVVTRTVYQCVDREPWSRERSYFPLDLAQETGIDVPHDIPQGTMRRLAEAGYREVAVVDEVSDEYASLEDAADLSVPVGVPLLVQTRTGATATRITRVVQVIRLGRRSRLVWEIGEPDALNLIRASRKRALDGEDGL